jgi:hypothetical protein
MTKPCKECDRLRKGFRLYVILRNKEQFTPPEIFEQISNFAGKPYQGGHLISKVVRDMEIALGIRD